MPQSHSQQRDCKMQRDRLAEEFTTTLNAFQDIQRQAYQKEKEEQRNRASSGIPPPPSSRRTDPFNEQLIELQDSNTRQQIQEHLEDERNLQIMEDQERTIQQLERDISDVNKIFKDLGALVHDQGEVIDSIEANVEKTEVSVSEGRNQLRTAEQYSVRILTIYTLHNKSEVLSLL
ncbi:hypothetical protein AAG570_004301 [Ranatra chinensis]|uniref:t-SNARE coiled-coil homology domain-containing protein n=1 Tax=Ranatra chinensis TaxID=642074 RepID=A0ABD0YD44_9HEMI